MQAQEQTAPWDVTLCRQMNASRRFEDRSVFILKGRRRAQDEECLALLYLWRYVRRYPLARHRVTSQKNRIVSSTLWQTETSQHAHIFALANARYHTWLHNVLKVFQDRTRYLQYLSYGRTTTKYRVTVCCCHHVKVSHRDYIPQRLTVLTDRYQKEGEMVIVYVV